MKLPFLITNPKSGEKSVSLTILVTSYSALLLWFVFGGILNVEFIRPFDAGIFMEIFTPCAALYFGNKWNPRARALAEQIGKVSTSRDLEEAPHPIDESDENPGG